MHVPLIRQKNTLRSYLVFVLVIVGMYAPHAPCARGVKPGSIISLFAGLRITPRAQIIPEHAEQAANPFGYPRRINTSALNFKSKPEAASDGLNVKGTEITKRSNTFGNNNRRYRNGGGNEGGNEGGAAFSASAGGVAGSLFSLLGIGVAVGWLTIDFDTYSISPLQRVNQLVAYRSSKVVKKTGVPEALVNQVQQDMNHYFFDSYQFDKHSDVRRLLVNGATKKGAAKYDENKPAQGEWKSSASAGMARNNVSISCERGRCRLAMYMIPDALGRYSKEEPVEFPLGTLHMDPENKDDLWGVIPTISSLAHQCDDDGLGYDVTSLVGPRGKGLPRPYVVHARVNTAEGEQDELQLEYFDLKAKSVLQCIWHRNGLRRGQNLK